MDFQKNIDRYLLEVWPIKGWTVEEIKAVSKQLDVTFVEIFSVLNTESKKAKKPGRKPRVLAP